MACTLWFVLRAVYTVQCTLFSVLSTMYILRTILLWPWCQGMAGSRSEIEGDATTRHAIQRVEHYPVIRRNDYQIHAEADHSGNGVEWKRAGQSG